MSKCIQLVVCVFCCAKVEKIGNEITSGVSLLKLSNVDEHWGKLRREI